MKKILDCRRFLRRTEAHEYIFRELCFPEHYGRNLDALADCLGEFSGMIILENARVLEENPGYGLRILHVFREAGEENPGLSVAVFEGRIPPRNRFHKNLSRLEFVMSYACTGRCIHCSEAGKDDGSRLDGRGAAAAVAYAAAVYGIESVMAFGGEPLLAARDVARIMRAAKNCEIPVRQIITNGFFSRNPDEIRKTAGLLWRSGVNNVLISADAFHQETIPLEPVKLFAEELLRLGVRASVNPAWLVSEEDGNPYNLRTREILAELQKIGLEASSGNVVFREGNAARYLGEYFAMSEPPENPYEQDPEDVRAVCLNPDGRLYGGIAYGAGILEAIGE